VCVSTAGWHTVENITEDADDCFFSVVTYIMKIMLYPLLPERNE